MILHNASIGIGLQHLGGLFQHDFSRFFLNWITYDWTVSFDKLACWHIIPGAGVRRGGSGEKSEIFIVKFVRRKVHPEEHFFRKIDLWKKGEVR